MTPKGKIAGMLQIRGLPEKTRLRIIQTLTHPNPAYVSASRYSPWGPPKDIPEEISFAYERNGVLYVPRGYDPEISLPPKSERIFKSIRWSDRRTTHPVKFPGLHITPSKEQEKLLRSFTRAVSEDQRPYGAFLLVAPTSAGKTILQALCARATNQRTLVICHTNLIRNAWWGDLYTAFGIAKKDVGLIQQGTMRIGEHFTLASTATLDKREEHWPALWKEFGCLIVDEAHKLEPRLLRMLRSCRCKYIIGATATPEPIEGGIDYCNIVFGQPIKRLISTTRDTKSSMSLRTVEIVKTKFTYKYDRDNLDVHDLGMAIATDEERNQLIVDNAIADWEEGHSVLIAGKRTAHLRLLHAMLLERGVEDANLLYGETNSKKRYTEALTKAVLTRKVRMLVSTVLAIKLGANLNPLDRLHLVYPCNSRDLEQLIGRIRRRAEGKTDTILKYYVDAQMPYLNSKYFRHAIPTFRKLRVPGYENLYTV